MREYFKRNFYATTIGSVPHTDAREICEEILNRYLEIPFWPQMPRRSFFENMYVQFLEGFPCVIIDEYRKKIWVDTSKDFLSNIEKVYQKIIDGDIDYFSMTEKCALGFYEFINQVKTRDIEKYVFLKGQITGPISLGLSVTDEKSHPILYNSDLSEIATKILAMKARYQIRKLKCVSGDIIIFIDEPYLVSVGSSVINIKRDDVISKVGEIVETIHQEGALAGIHCCGNTDWSLLLGLKLDILSFDAYNFSESISLYPDQLKNFFAEGKVLAWGITPTSDKVWIENEETLIKRLKDGISYLSQKGINEDIILEQLIVTPSCGCGAISRRDADRVLNLNLKVSKRLKEFYGR